MGSNATPSVTPITAELEGMRPRRTAKDLARRDNRQGKRQAKRHEKRYGIHTLVKSPGHG